MLELAICDDDVKFAGKLETMLSDIAKQEHIELDIEVYFGGRGLVENIDKEKKRYDMIFLDIEMQDMNGLEAARKIRETDEITLLIYVTSHESYAVEAYEVQPFQFAVKPVNENIIHKYFMKAYGKVVAGTFYYQYKYEKEYHKVLINNIMYFESKGRVIIIHMSDGNNRQYYDKLNEIAKRIKKEKVNFWRIHQSYLVNIRYIERKSYDQIELKDGKILYISEDRRNEISEIYCKYVEGEIIE